MTSAVIPGLHSVIRDSDHLKLGSFADADDGYYESVSSNIARIAPQAPTLLRQRKAGELCQPC